MQEDQGRPEEDQPQGTPGTTAGEGDSPGTTNGQGGTGTNEGGAPADGVTEGGNDEDKNGAEGAGQV